MPNRMIPKFATEAEEAQWWYDHRDELAQDFVEASRAGTLGAGFRERLATLRTKRIQAEELDTVPAGNE